MDQNHNQLTKSRDRSKSKLGNIFGIFEFMVDMGERSQIRGNQKLLIPVDMGSLVGLTLGWPDLHGFDAGSEGIPDEHDERNTNAR